MIIIDARFGEYIDNENCAHIGENDMDITAAVAALIDPRTRTINWNHNHAHRHFGDPMVGTRKSVKVSYQETKDGPIHTKCFHESDTPDRNVTIVLP